MRLKRLSVLRLVALACVVAPALAQQEPKFSDDEKRTFLLSAQVTNSKQTSKGVTAPWKLTLVDKKKNITWYGKFQSIDDRKPSMSFATGRTEMNFRDSYHFNIAAYEISKLLGLNYMMPVTVERKWAGKTGALEWWMTVKWDEGDRLKQKLQPPDPEAWNKQMHRMRVFSQLVYDTDRNLGNVLITEDWQLKMIDFTRAFRLFNEVENAKNLVRFDRLLIEKLRALDVAKVQEATKQHLGSDQVKAIMARRDKILEIASKLAQEKGENDVLY